MLELNKRNHSVLQGATETPQVQLRAPYIGHCVAVRPSALLATMPCFEGNDLSRNSALRPGCFPASPEWEGPLARRVSEVHSELTPATANG